MKALNLSLAVTVLFISASFSWAQGNLAGQKAPDFTLKSIDGEKAKLADFLEEGPVLLDFWATWCVPCKQALPHLAKIHESYKDQGFKLVSISTDNTRSVGKVRPYVKSQKWEFPVLLDTDNEVLKRYRANSVPMSVLISTEGLIIKTWIGYHPGEEKDIEKEVKKLLASKTEPQG
ncbi:MAG: TlpA disulfide reductase family protein [Candidatus Electryonea clarkiae]|nr:TlpA disulfide reductase family protein [Candidatus Electryonea clarkiae]MDP8289252.1 TlpA disulfide reductase family protein [Candidatus Electryonea clarkiae]